jgi:AraC family transcriptional regulator of arabinose operon
MDSPGPELPVVTGPPGPWVRTGEPLLWLAGAGRELRDPSYFHDARTRKDPPHVTLQLTLCGQGFYDSRRQERRPLPPGTAFLDAIPGPFAYGYPPGATEPYELVFASISGPVAAGWAKRIVSRFGHVLDFGPPDESPVPALMLDIVRRSADGALGDRYAASGLLYQLFMTVLSTLSTFRVATEQRVSRAIAIISQRATERSFNVLALADELDCSREYLARRFRATTGVSPGDYLAQQRIRLVAQALRAGDDKLESVARRSGFSNANYLCRVFKKHVGVTPAVFRSRGWMAVP